MPETREPDPTRDYGLTTETMQSWTKGQRKCRTRKRHHWGPGTVYVHPTFYDVTERCPDCRNERHADFSRSGRQLTKWKAGYKDGYLMPKGAAPVDEDMHDELMLTDLLNRKLVEVTDEEEAD